MSNPYPGGEKGGGQGLPFTGGKGLTVKVDGHLTTCRELSQHGMGDHAEVPIPALGVPMTALLFLSPTPGFTLPGPALFTHDLLSPPSNNSP